MDIAQYLGITRQTVSK
ncbi:MAG: hypothetical protein GX490_04750 [Bacilli bacterium]|nr:hypothetical protein [Bacilli bacterium]